MTTRGDSPGELAEAVRALRAAVSESTYPLPVPSAEPAAAAAAAMLAQIDDYLLPRLGNLNAPLLVGVGGPTGAGKSTTVNSLIRSPASAAGVLRPTTRAPVLVCNPADAAWFRTGPLLGGLARTSGRPTEPEQLHLVTAPAMASGCAFLDTPDIDSVVTTNREAAARLLATADLWLFVTTAARYADAVPWELLQTAQERGTTVAMLLNRVPSEAAEEVTGQVSELLVTRGLDEAALFVQTEARVDGQGLLPEAVIEPLRNWFDTLAADQQARTGVVGRTLDGALAALPAAVTTLVAAADEQVATSDALAEQVGVAYGTARATVEQGIRDGTLLRGEAMTRWREFVDSGQWKGANLAGSGRSRVRLPVPRRPRAGRALAAAVQAGLVALVRSAVVDAAEHTDRAWSAYPAGATLLTSQPQAPTLADADDQAARLAHDWRREVFALVEADSGGARSRGAQAAHATGALVVVAAVAPPTGGDGSTDPVHEQVLAITQNDQAIRALATKAREDLLARVAVLLDAEAARYLDRLAGAWLDSAPAQRLREATAELERARQAAALSELATEESVAAGSAAEQVDPEPPAEPKAAREGTPEEAER